MKKGLVFFDVYMGELLVIVDLLMDSNIIVFFKDVLGKWVYVLGFEDGMVLVQKLVYDIEYGENSKIVNLWMDYLFGEELF